ncbi:hypothetical protein D3C78_1171210 [compost metagenome]
MCASDSAPTPSSTSSGSLPLLASITLTAGGNSSATSARTLARPSASIRSALFSTTRSALASWSANSSCSGDSWSRLGSSLRWASTWSG